MASLFDRPGRAFRMADPRHLLFDGKGAFLKGGRWNSPGKRIIYAAETYAGALLESLVHLNFDSVPDGYAWIEILLPGTLGWEEVRPSDIPGWNFDDWISTRRFGDRWYEEKRTPVLLVPSVVTAGIERNLLINQEHADFSEIRPGSPRPVIWDERLFGRR
ncbi:MAG TPA: RES domain-containing protein [Terriglobales bacterium]|jgi:RES domain-containing protein